MVVRLVVHDDHPIGEQKDLAPEPLPCVERVRFDGAAVIVLESHLIYRDSVDACFVIARQHVRGIKTEFIGRTRQWLVIVDAPRRVFIRVSALDEFATDRIPETQGRAEALCQVLTQWWQDLGPMKRPAP